MLLQGAEVHSVDTQQRKTGTKLHWKSEGKEAREELRGALQDRDGERVG